MIYCRIFGIFIREKKLKNWDSLEIEDVKIASKHLTDILRLPLTEDVIDNMKYGLKIKSSRNNMLTCIPTKEKDRALGFILKVPSLITRKYSGYIKSAEFQKCPYCGQEIGNIMFH